MWVVEANKDFLILWEVKSALKRNPLLISCQPSISVRDKGMPSLKAEQSIDMEEPSKVKQDGRDREAPIRPSAPGTLLFPGDMQFPPPAGFDWCELD